MEGPKHMTQAGKSGKEGVYLQQNKGAACGRDKIQNKRRPHSKRAVGNKKWEIEETKNFRCDKKTRKKNQETRKGFGQTRCREPGNGGTKGGMRPRENSQKTKETGQTVDTKVC